MFGAPDCSVPPTAIVLPVMVIVICGSGDRCAASAAEVPEAARALP